MHPIDYRAQHKKGQTNNLKFNCTQCTLPVWFGFAWFGFVAIGLVWSGQIPSGLIQSRLIWSGLNRSGLIHLVWSGLDWSGMVTSEIPPKISVNEDAWLGPVSLRQDKFPEN